MKVEKDIETLVAAISAIIKTTEAQRLARERKENLKAK